jgi:hypothetical protein
MLEWMVRWGVPLALIAAFVLTAESRMLGPSAMANQVLDTIRDTLTGLIPKFF